MDIKARVIEEVKIVVSIVVLLAQLGAALALIVGASVACSHFTG